jgi:tRNA pseudouridine55 synthase
MLDRKRDRDRRGRFLRHVDGASLDGILLIDKPVGLTSAGVVREVKRRLGVAKIGHLGTLDPFATGLLPLAIGEGVKVVPFLNQEQKAYTGTITLGRTTDTLDATGKPTEIAAVPPLTAERLAEAAKRFCGEIEQIPPMFSALKRSGVRLYELARKGLDLELQPRRVRVDSLSLSLAPDGAIAVSVRCSKGTYIRSLARDIASALGTVGHLSSLRRTEFGRFGISNAVPLHAILPGVQLAITTPRAALADMRELVVDDRLAREIRFGQQRGLARLGDARVPKETAKLVGPRGELVAIVVAETGVWKILRVFPGNRCEDPLS